MKSLRLLPIAVIATGALTLTACGGSNTEANSDGDSFTIVTSTNVYANIAQHIAGDLAEVTPIISDSSKDPHSYEATSQDQLTLSEADLVIENGGGYDAFITTMLEAADEDPHLIDVVSISELEGSEDLGNEPHDHDHGHEHSDSEESHDHEHDHEGGDAADEHSESGESHEHDHEHSDSEESHEHDHDHGEFNEHVWYSVPTMVKLVDELEAELSKELPADADTIKENADSYRDKLQGVVDDIAEVKKTTAGKKSSATEPIPLWLFEDLGIENETPDEFLEAVEEGNDVSPSVFKEAEDQIANKEVDILAYNTQATNDQAEALKAKADEAGVPVVDMSETIPDDTDYVDWMSGYVDEIKSALS